MIQAEQLNSKKVIGIFQDSIRDWHKEEQPHTNPFPENTLENTLYQKNHVDTIQWHIEDEIRRPDIPLDDIMTLKRRIDKLNQDRTDTVEKIDDFIGGLLKDVTPAQNARLNSESPAWLVDRMSILELKIYHMQEQVDRTDVDREHIDKCQTKLSVLLEQRQDLSRCLDELIDDYLKGAKKFKVYRQMKMYNDQNLNPALYKQGNK
ncbi:MAG: DUF4254 domain-containing protein [Leptospira sp.]|nr:DUF4254 domain-containing protein [Leptospira sp.]